MATKMICDKCGEDVGSPRYTFKAVLCAFNDNAGTELPLNMSIPGCDLCVTCHTEVVNVLRDLKLPTIASTQT